MPSGSGVAEVNIGGVEHRQNGRSPNIKEMCAERNDGEVLTTKIGESVIDEYALIGEMKFDIC